MTFTAVPYTVPEARYLNNPTLAVWGGRCVGEAACRRHATTNDKLQIHRHIPFVLAGADVDHLHLDIFLGDEDADVVADGREIAILYGKNLFVQYISCMSRRRTLPYFRLCF